MRTGLVTLASFFPLLILPSVTNAVHVSAGQHAACAIASDGSLVYWGSNAHGVLAVDPGTIDVSSTPVTIPFPSGTKIAQVVVAQDTVCARTTAGDVCAAPSVVTMPGSFTRGALA